MCAKNLAVKLVKPLLGFADTYHFELKAIPENPLFFCFESEDGPSFIITKPTLFFADYTVEIKKDDLQDLLIDGNELEVYAIVTIPNDPLQMTANLMAPLLINEEKGLGSQMVFHNSQYTTRHYLFPPEKRSNCG